MPSVLTCFGGKEQAALYQIFSIARPYLDNVAVYCHFVGRGFSPSRTYTKIVPSQLRPTTTHKKHVPTTAATPNPRRLRLLHLAAFEGSVDTVLLLLSAGASVNAQDLDGWTPLMYASRNETDGAALVPTLVAAGADLDKKNNRRRTGERQQGGGALIRNTLIVCTCLYHCCTSNVASRE